MDKVLQVLQIALKYSTWLHSKTAYMLKKEEKKYKKKLNVCSK